MDNTFSFTHKQPSLMFLSLSMFEPRCKSTFLRDYTWFKTGKEFLGLMTLNLTVLYRTST